MMFILGPCAIESKEHADFMAGELVKIRDEIRQEGYSDFDFIFKASYHKPVRGDVNSFHGIGQVEGGSILQHIKTKHNLKVTADVHSMSELTTIGSILDLIQIPHHRCKDTALIKAAAAFDKPMSVKKGSFLSPYDFHYIIEKIRLMGNEQTVVAVERGSSFGYNDTIVDMRNFSILKNSGLNVVTCIDGSHPVSDSTHIAPIVKAGVAAGADMVFIETHNKPTEALCDGKRSYPLSQLKQLILETLQIHNAVKVVEWSK